MPLVPLIDLSVQFDVRKEEKSTEADATIKLFGEEGHADVAYHIHHEFSKEQHLEVHK